MEVEGFCGGKEMKRFKESRGVEFLVFKIVVES